MLDVSFFRLFCSNFIFHLSFSNFNFIPFRCLQKFSLEGKLICRLITNLKQSITFASNNLSTKVFAFLLERLINYMRAFKQSSLYYAFLTRTNSNKNELTYEGPINLRTQSKLLLQLPCTLQALVFLLEYRIQKLKKYLDRRNAKHTF